MKMRKAFLMRGGAYWVKKRADFYSSKNGDDGDDAEVEEDEGGGEEVAAELVLHGRHVEDDPACVADGHEGGEVEKAVEHFDAIVFVEDDHDEGHQTNKQNNHQRIDYGLPDRVPRIVCFLFIHHVNPIVYPIQKINVNPCSKAELKLAGLTTFTRILQTRLCIITNAENNMVKPTGITIEAR